jgi:2-methylcitrate dehydratase PrpD
MIDGEVGLAQFTDERVRSPEPRGFLEKVRYVHPGRNDGDSALPTSPETVTVKLKGGRELSHRVEWPRGDPHNPMSREELVSKYKACAERFLSPAALERSVEIVLNMENLGNVSELVELVTAGAPAESDRVE